MTLRRLPIESTRPVVTLAVIRLALSVLSLVLTVALGFPYQGRLALVLAAVAVPWGVGNLVLARRSPAAAVNAGIAVGDLALLVVIELVVPETYGAVRFAALFFIAVHAHVQGEARGLAIAGGGTAALVAASLIRGAGDLHGDLLTFYESVFVVVAVGTALLVGRMRTAESASRLRARGLTRRTIEGEREVRRRVAESLHDGPVQELIALDMVLSAAGHEAKQGHRERLEELLRDARELTERNVRALREEIVDLGPYAFEELSYAVAVENCVPIWRRRYGIEVLLQLEELELPAELAGDLFHITQEATVNAGRHAQASTVSIALRSVDGNVELRVMDDGNGFGDVDPLGPVEPGHLGLASIRERIELLDGELDIETSQRGTKLVARAPLGRRGRLARRGRSGR